MLIVFVTDVPYPRAYPLIRVTPARGCCFSLFPGSRPSCSAPLHPAAPRRQCDDAGSVELLSFVEEDTTVEWPQESDGEEFDFLRSEYASTGAPVAADADDAAI